MRISITMIMQLLFILAALLISGCGDSITLENKAAATENSKPENLTLVEDEHAGHDHSATSEDIHELDWCAEHLVPESVCTKCNPTLIDGFKETGDWCGGHDLPESQCRLCNPGIVFPQEEILRSRTIDISGSEIAVTLNFRPNAAACATDGAIIQFASEQTAQRAGITVQTTRNAQLEFVEEAPAEILFDETETAAITISVPASVTRWLVSPGETVAEGDLLAILQSPEIAGLRSDLVAANAAYELEQKELTRHSQMQEQGLISALDWERQSTQTKQAKAKFIGARSLLLTAGLTEDDINDVLEYGSLSNQITLRAPADGVIIERKARLGSLLETGSTFATIGNPDALWIEARLTEQQMRLIDIGNQLTFSSDGGAVNRIGGEIIWLSRFLDPHTRTGTVRARVLDRNHQLRAGEFGRARIVAKEDETVRLVPRDAVQWEGCCNVVFVREAIDRYRPRKVQLIDSNGPFYQISEGVQYGEEVVVDGSFLMKTELKKSSIGAGCCGLEPVG